MAGSSVHEILLAEARQEIATLRTDLYSTRRLAEERRQNEQALLKVNQELQVQVNVLSNQVSSLSVQADQLSSTQQQLQQCQQQCEQLQKDLDVGTRARRILESELAGERQVRAQVEEAKASLESERARLLKVRDDLTASLRVAERKAREAEEEQLRAEEEVVQLRQEMKALQAAHSLGLPGSPPTNGWAAPSFLQHNHNHNQLMPSTNDDSSHQNHDGSMNSTTNKDQEKKLQQAMELLESERGRAAALLSSLQEARTEVITWKQQVDALHATNNQLHQQVQQLEQHVRDHVPSGVEPPSVGGHRASKVDEQGTACVPEATALQQTPPLPPLPAGVSSSASQDQPSTPPAAPNSHKQHKRHASVSTAVSDGEFVDMEAKQLQAQMLDGQWTIPGLALLRDPLPRCLQISKLKASRDKLLEQIDRQWEEMDRLSIENRSLYEEMERLQQLITCWEAQAQGSLSAEERLKEMLEEAATWANDRGAVAALLAEKARVADLELQIRALSGELIRAKQAHMTLGKAVAPSFTSIEQRLAQLVGQSKQVRAALTSQQGNGQTRLHLIEGAVR